MSGPYDDEEAHRNRRPDKTYVSPRLSSFGGAPVRIARKVIDGKGGYFYAKEKSEVVLKEAPPSRFELVAKFLEDDRRVTSVTIQKFIKAGAKEFFTLYPDEVTRLLTFFANLKRVHFPDEKGLNITDEALEDLLVEPEQARRVLRGRPELIAALARTEVTEEDVVALAYRKEALKRFQRLLEDAAFFEAEASRVKGPEQVWQDYFEKNPWIFGYGLSYIFLRSLEGKKLEQVVRGFDLTSSGKRADGVLKTQAQISSLCFVEIKHHKTPLLAASSVRPGIWHPHADVAAAISQVQGTVALALEPWRSQFRPTDDHGAPTGEVLQTIEPRSFLVTGSLGQLMTEHGVHQDKFRSFELFRRNIVRPEIITFDELYHRARFIVENS
jgi:hypothetical protein